MSPHEPLRCGLLCQLGALGYAVSRIHEGWDDAAITERMLKNYGEHNAVPLREVLNHAHDVVDFVKKARKATKERPLDARKAPVRPR